MIRKIIKKIINFLVNLNKFSKSIILVLNDTFFLFFSWLIFYAGTTIFASELQLNNAYYLNQIGYVFLIPLLVYLVSMHIFNGFNEVVRSFNLNNIFPLFFSIIFFIFCAFFTDTLVNKNSSELINILQSFATGAVGFIFILFSRIFFRIASTESFKKKIKKKHTNFRNWKYSAGTI